jgi:hypothetical protein
VKLDPADLGSSPFTGKRSGGWCAGDGSPMPRFHPVQTDFDVVGALPRELLDRLGFKNEIFHMIGNVGELVKYDEKAAGDAAYRVAGGDFNTHYKIINIQDDIVNPMTYTKPNQYIGFRMVADADESFASKLKKARP